MSAGAEQRKANLAAIRRMECSVSWYALPLHGSGQRVYGDSLCDPEAMQQIGMAASIKLWLWVRGACVEVFSAAIRAMVFSDDSIAAR